MALTREIVADLLDEKLQAQNVNLMTKIDEKIDAAIGQTLTQHTNILNEHEKRIVELENTIEDQQNRIMRNNIIIKGVSEDNYESWSETKSLVCKIISGHLNYKEEKILSTSGDILLFVRIL